MLADPLVILDFQNDFTRALGKLPACVKEVDLAIPKVNAAIAAWMAGGQEVVVLSTQWVGWIARILGKHSVAPGTPGAQLDRRIAVRGIAVKGIAVKGIGTGEVIGFVKPHHSAFTSRGFVEFLDSRRIHRITLCGLGTELAVARTARDALARGIQVTLLMDATAPRREGPARRALAALDREGAILRGTLQVVNERFGSGTLPLERTDPVMALRLACQDTKPNALGEGRGASC